MTKLDIKITTMDYYCGASTFTINGKDADESDFGSMIDQCPEDAPDYGCGCRVFERICSTPEVLEKYGISEEEYLEICVELTEKLYFGRCALCA